MRLTRLHWDGLFAEAYTTIGGLEPAEDAFIAGVLAAWRDLRSVEDPDQLEALLRDQVARRSAAEAGRHPPPPVAPRNPAELASAFEIDVEPHLPERTVDELTDLLPRTAQRPAWRVRLNALLRLR